MALSIHAYSCRLRVWGCQRVAVDLSSTVHLVVGNKLAAKSAGVTPSTSTRTAGGRASGFVTVIWQLVTEMFSKPPMDSVRSLIALVRVESLQLAAWM
jgi:hypothetical protein